VPVPHQWRTYTYHKAQISIPRGWAGVTNYLCAGSASVGMLYLGRPKGPPYASCPSDVGQGDSVTITSLPADTVDQPQCSFTMNGLRVHYGPCSSSNAAGVIFYDIPTLGIRAEGTGGNNQNVRAWHWDGGRSDSSHDSPPLGDKRRAGRLSAERR
jgi:hypothetical protein